MMRRFWACAVLADDDPRPYVPSVAPPWGCSGQRADGKAIICALIDIDPRDGADGADALVRAHWPVASEAGAVSVFPKSDDWMPEPTRWACIHEQMTGHREENS